MNDNLSDLDVSSNKKQCDIKSDYNINKQTMLTEEYKENFHKISEFEKYRQTGKNKEILSNLGSKIEVNDKINFPIEFSTLFGGEDSNYCEAVEVDSSNNIIITGYTDSGNFPILDAYDNTINGDFDCFVMKFSNSGSLLWSTYLGGSERDYGYAIAVDSFDNIIVTGSTTSSDFPIYAAYDSTFNGGSNDGFITKLSSSGSLIWSTFLGGGNNDYAKDITVNEYDNIMVTGCSDSADFPMLNAHDDTFNGGFTDIFLTNFSSDGELLWSTFFGGDSDDDVLATALDSSDNIIITGFTESRNFPTLNAFDNTFTGGNSDIFISKFSSSGSIIWSTFLGGSDNDIGEAIAVDNSDSILVTGHTLSSDFPTLNSYSSHINGIQDVFLTKYSSSGSLLWSTYLGGSKSEYCEAITIDGSNNIIISGRSSSLDDFPILNVYDNIYNGGFEDVFIAKFSSKGELLCSAYLGGTLEDYSKDLIIDKDGKLILIGTTRTETRFPTTNEQLNYSYVYSTSRICFLIKFSSLFQPMNINDDYEFVYGNLLGGNDISIANGVGIDHSGNAIIVGGTYSDDFSTFNAYDNAYNGNQDVFITKFSSNGSLLWSTYLGGNESDHGVTIAIDSFDNIIIAGNTKSIDFPILNAYDDTHNGGGDAFITKFSSSGELLLSTFIGGSTDDNINAISVDSNNNILITGVTSSINFPALHAYSSSNGKREVFITKFSNNGTLLWSNYLGGSDQDYGEDIAIDSSDNIILTGATRSFYFPIINAYDYNHNGGVYDAFVTKITNDGLLLWSTYLGGNDYDRGEGIAVDSSDNIIVAGNTESIDFPTTTGAYDSTFNGGSNDGFITKFTSDGILLWSTYFGGSNSDEVTAGIVTNSKDEIIVSGTTSSDDFNSDSSLHFFELNRDYCFFVIYSANGKFIDSSIFKSNSDMHCRGLTYNFDFDLLIFVGYLWNSNILLDTTYIEVDGTYQDNVFIIVLKYNTKREILQSIITGALITIIIIAGVSIIVALYKYNLDNLNNRKINIIKETIEDSKKLVILEDQIKDIDSTLWNIIEEFLRYEKRNKAKFPRKYSSDGIDNIIINLPSLFESNQEKLFIALNRVIYRRNGIIFLSYLNSQIYDRIIQKKFLLKIPDNEFMVKVWSIPFYTKNSLKKNLLEIHVEEKHYKLLASLITNIEYLEHLHWEFLPILSEITINYLSSKKTSNTGKSYIEIAISTLSLDFKILFSEFISKSDNSYNLDTIETILQTISVSELLNLPEIKLEFIIRRIAKLGIIKYPLPIKNKDISKIPFRNRRNLVSLFQVNKIIVSKELLSNLLK